MPDTLAHPFGWKNIPEWERSILWGLKEEVEKIPQVQAGIRQPSEAWGEEYWYGIELWHGRGYFSTKCLGIIYSYGDVLSWVKIGGPTTKWELADPDSIPRLIEQVRRAI